MDSSHNEGGGWMPPWSYPGDPYAVLIAKSGATGVTTSWKMRGNLKASIFVANFLDARLRSLSESELWSDANYLYVLLRRAPEPTDKSSELGDDTPIAEFGYGSPPTSPEDWPLIELRALLESAVDCLRDQSSP